MLIIPGIPRPTPALVTKGSCSTLSLKKLHGVVVLGGVFDVEAVLRGGMHRPCKHVAHLQFHHQGQGNQEYRQDILHHDEHLAQDHLVAAPERAFDDVDGLVARGDDGRKQAVDHAQDQDTGQVGQDIAGREHEGKPYAGVKAQHHLVRVAGGDQAVHHGSQQVGQQERQRETDGGESHGFADVLPQDAGLVGPQKPPGGHFLGPLSRERQAQVHIVEDGRQQEQQHDDGQQAQHLGIARAGEPVAAAGEEEGLVHAVGVPSVHLFGRPGGVVVPVQQGVHFGLDCGRVRILAHAEPGGVVADAVERLLRFGRPGGGDVRDDVHRHKEGATVKIGKCAFDGTVFLVHLYRLANLGTGLPGQGLADEDVVLAHEVLQAAFQQAVLREYPEEIGVGFDPGDLEDRFAALDERLPEERHVCGILHFRDVHFQLFLVPIGQAQEIVAAQREGALPLPATRAPPHTAARRMSRSGSQMPGSRPAPPPRWRCRAYCGRGISGNFSYRA